jgi:twinkle protein
LDVPERNENVGPLAGPGAWDVAEVQLPRGSDLLGRGAFCGPEAIPARRLSKETCEKFNYWLNSGPPAAQVANYTDERGVVVAQKLRKAGKEFTWLGKPKGVGLFGQHLWREGGKRVVITEGEIDAMSVSQAMGNRWPAVSVKNGAAGAYKDVAAQLQWLSTYETVVLLFDQDEAGRSAAAKVATLFEPGKVAIAQIPMKDAGEMLVAGQAAALVSACWEAKVYRPENIFDAIDLLDEVVAPIPFGTTYPWPCLDKLTHGQRTHELVVWTAGTGIGKSAILREIAHHLHTTHGHKVGYIALEESRRHTALSQLSLAMNRPLHIPESRSFVTEAEMRAAAPAALSGIYIYDGSRDLEQIAPAIRYMAKAHGCRYIILDHLSIMMSGRAQEGDERKRIDETMTALRSSVQELGIGLHLVSHLRKPDGTPYEEGGQVSLNGLRGSGAIGQLADIVIGLERNQQDPNNSNVTTFRVVKNRFSGETGISGYLDYSPVTGRLTECQAPTPFEDERNTGEL